MSNTFIRLPPELRIQVYGYLIHNDVPRIPSYAGLRTACRQMRDEFDHKLLPVLQAYHEAQVATFLGPQELIEDVAPPTFEESRTLAIWISSTWLEQNFLSKTFRHYKGTRRLRDFFDALSPHIREVESRIRFGDSGVRSGIDAFTVFGFLAKLDDLTSSEYASFEQQQYIRLNVDRIYLHWSDRLSAADCRKIGNFMVKRDYPDSDCYWILGTKDGPEMKFGRKIIYADWFP